MFLELETTQDTITLNKKYVILLRKLLGKGTYGDVHQGYMYQKENEKIAIKTINKKKFEKRGQQIIDQIMNYAEREKSNQQRLHSQNVVKFLDLLYNDEYIYLILEYCGQGSLQDKLKEGRITQMEALQIFKQIINGFKELRNKNIIHRDLKPDNILFQDGIAKIGDFGFSKNLEDIDSVQAQTCLGTFLYMAPEVATGNYSSKCDIWSLGSILYIMLRNLEVGESSVNHVKQEIKSLTFPNNIHVSDEVLSLLRKMLTVDPNKRIGWDDLFAEQLLQLIVLPEKENPNSLTVSKAEQIRVVISEEQKVQNIFEYFLYISDILFFIQNLMRDILVIHKLVGFTKEQKFRYCLITVKYIENELRFFKKILNGENLFFVEIVPSDFQLFRKSDKYSLTLKNFNQNFINVSKNFNQQKENYKKFLSSNQEGKVDNNQEIDNFKLAIESDKNDTTIYKEFNKTYSQIVQHIQEKTSQMQLDFSQKDNVMMVLIKLLYCFQPLTFNHITLDKFKVEERLRTTSSLEQEFNSLYKDQWEETE